MKRVIDPSHYVACRQHCAANLALMTEFIINKSSLSQDILFGIMKVLATDSCYVVRRITASNFQDIARGLGPSVKMIKEIFLQLLRDNSDDVLMCLIPNLAATLNAFYAYNVLQTKEVVSVTVSLTRTAAN